MNAYHNLCIVINLSELYKQKSVKCKKMSKAFTHMGTQTP